MALNSRLVFNEAYYLAQNADVRAAIGVLQPDGVTRFTSGLDHFTRFGEAEGRVATPLFNVDAYKANNPDLADAGLTTDAQLRTHFYTYGAAEGRNALAPTVFNLEYYKAQNADLVNAGLTDAQIVRHFYEYGAAEGRAATVNFSVAAYKAANADLAGLSDTVARGHWYTYGAGEGRAFPQLAQSFALTQSATQVAEGSALTFTITSALPVTEDTSFTFNVTGDTNGGTIDAAANADFTGISGSVSIGAGSTSITFTINPTLDTTFEGLEGFKVTVFNSALAVVGSKTAIITDNSANAPQAFTLTSSADSMTGGSANDTYTGVVNASTPTSSTLTSGDVLTGGAGTDAVNVSITGSGTSTTTGVSLVGIERIAVSNFESGSNTATINLSLADSSLTTLALAASTAGTTTDFTSVNKLVGAEMSNGAGNLTLSYGGTVTTGATTQALALNGQTAGTFTSAGVETLNVTSSGSASSITIGGTDATTVNVTASVATTLVGPTSVTTFSAAGSSGAVTFTAQNTGDVTLTGGTGNDTFKLGANLTATDVIDGGVGTGDKIEAQGTLADTAFTKVTNVEALSTTTGQAITVTLADKAQAAGIAAVTGAAGQITTVTTSTGFTNALAVTLGTGTVNDSITNSANVALTVTGGAATQIASTDVLTGGTGTDTLIITADDSGTGANLTGVTNFETVTINAGSTATVDVKVTVVDATIASTKTLTTSAVALTNSSADLTYDGSAVTGDRRQHVTGGAGKDTVSGGAGNDVIDGGAGNDSITAGEGSDSLLGGDGDDTFVLAGNLTSADTINGGAGNDTLKVTSVTSSGLTNVTNVENLAITGATTVNLAGNLSFTTFDLSDASSQIVVLESGYTNATTFAIGAGDRVTNNANVATTITAVAANLEAADNTTITGGTGTDTLKVTADATTANIVSLNTIDVDRIEVVDGDDTTTGGKDITIELATVTVSTLIDGRALDGSNEVLTVTDAGTSTGKLTIYGGAGNDVIAAGNNDDVFDGGAGNDSIEAKTGNDSLAGGAGNDTFNLGVNLTFQDTIDGGDGTADLLSVSSVGAAINDVDFTNVKNVEALTIAAGTNTVTLSSLAQNAGIRTVNVAANLAAVVTASAYSAGITYSVAAGTDANVNLTGGTSDDTFVFNGSLLTVNDSAVGGSGTDTIRLDNNTSTSDATGDAVTAVLGAGVTGMDRVLVNDIADGDTNGDVSLTFNTAYAQTTIAISVDGSALDSGETLTVDASANVAAERVSVLGGEGADTLTGGAGNDTLSGAGGADVITGGTGADVLTGGAGSDVFSYTAATNGTLSSDSQNTSSDSISDFAAGTDSIRVNLTLAATSTTTRTVDGTKKVDAASNADALASLSSKIGQFFYNKATSQFVMDTNGDGLVQDTDLFVTLTGSTTLAEADVDFHVTGSTGADTITTGAGDDSISGGDDVDVVTTAAGADTIDGGAGADNLSGGDGNDTFNITTLAHAHTLAETISGGSGTDTIVIGAAGALQLESATVTGIEAITYHSGGNTVTVTSTAFEGVGTLTGGAGTDIIKINDATKTVDLSTKTLTSIEQIDLSATANFNVTGTSGADTFVFGTALTVADSVNGGSGNDTLTFTDGDSTTTDLDKVTSIETITLGNAATTVTTVDALVASGANLVLDGSALTGVALTWNGAAETNGTFSITSGTGADVITGGSGADTITSGTGADTITGGAGNDVINVNTGTTNNEATADVVILNAVVGTSADSSRVTVVGNDNDTGGDTITNFAFTGTDDILRVVATNVSSFVHATDTAIGTATGGVNDGTAGSFLATTGLIELNQTTNNSWTDAGDIAVTFSNALGLDVTEFRAALQYNLTGTSTGDTITTGGLADTVDGGAGGDTITGGAGNDSITGGEGTDTIVIGSGQDTVILTETTPVADTIEFSTAFATNSSANAATITGFANGAGADLFDVGFALQHGTLTFAAGTGATNTISASAPVTVADNGTTAANTGVIFLLAGANDQLAGGTTAANAVANAVTALTSGADFAASNVATGDSLILVMDDGVNSFVFHYVADGTAATTAAADLELIAIINGVTDAGTFTTGDFI